MIRVFAAAALAVAFAAPATAVAPPVTAIDAGGARAFVQPDPGVPLAGVMLHVRAGLDRQTAAQNGLAALTAEAVLRTPVASTLRRAQDGLSPGQAVPLADAVEAAGASISYAVGPQGVRFYLEGTPERLALAAPLVAGALGAPAFDPATLAAARASLGERIADEDGDPRLVGRAMLRSAYYRGGAGLPALGNPAALAALGAADLKTFYDTWYTRGDAVASAVGRTGDATDAASRVLLAALHAGTARATALGARPLGAQPKRILTHRDLGAPYVVLGFAAPSLGERDFPAALVMRALLGSVFERAGATTRPPLLRSVGLIYGYDASPAQLVLWINGSRIDPEVGLTGIGAIAKAAATKPLTAAVLARYKETARGEWALETVTLDERASAIGNAVELGLPAGAADDVAAAIARVTAADVVRVAKKYFRKFDVALVLPRGNGN
jgi:predicted Zn-dependent peptidase